MTNPIKTSRFLKTLVATFIILSLASTPTLSQQAIENGSVQQMSPALEVKPVPYRGNRILFHIRTGIERAVIFPEPVQLARTNPQLLGCTIVVDFDVVGFYPTQSFDRETVRLIGLETGTTYELGVRASPEGLLNPLRLTVSSDN